MPSCSGRPSGTGACITQSYHVVLRVPSVPTQCIPRPMLGCSRPVSEIDHRMACKGGRAKQTPIAVTRKARQPKNVPPFHVGEPTSLWLAKVRGHVQPHRYGAATDRHREAGSAPPRWKPAGTERTVTVAPLRSRPSEAPSPAPPRPAQRVRACVRAGRWSMLCVTSRHSTSLHVNHNGHSAAGAGAGAQRRRGGESEGRDDPAANPVEAHRAVGGSRCGPASLERHSDGGRRGGDGGRIRRREYDVSGGGRRAGDQQEGDAVLHQDPARHAAERARCHVRHGARRSQASPRASRTHATL